MSEKFSSNAQKVVKSIKIYFKYLCTKTLHSPLFYTALCTSLSPSLITILTTKVVGKGICFLRFSRTQMVNMHGVFTGAAAAVQISCQQGVGGG